MVWGSWRLNIIWKLLRNNSGVLLEILEIDSGLFFNVKVYFLNIFCDLKFIFRKMWEFRSDISTYTNKSRPGTLFKMCSRSWEYWRFQYHQKLLTQNRSCGLSKIWNLLFDLFWGDPHNPPIHQKISWKFLSGCDLKSKSGRIRGIDTFPGTVYPRLQEHFLEMFSWMVSP